MGKPAPKFQEPLDAPPSYSEATAGSSSRPPPLPQAQRPQQRPPTQPTQPTQPQLQPTQPALPWTYPQGFRCTKCANTGYKIKNGKSCKSCWERFARQHNVSVVPSVYTGGFRIPFTNMSLDLSQPMPMSMPMSMPVNMAPRYVAPGDPSIGGVRCGRCRGTGRVTVMLIDEDICPVCHGVGRVF